LVVSRGGKSWNLGAGAVAESATSFDLLVSKVEGLGNLVLSVELDSDGILSESGSLSDSTAGSSREGLSLSRLVLEGDAGGDPGRVSISTVAPLGSVRSDLMFGNFIDEVVDRGDRSEMRGSVLVFMVVSESSNNAEN